MTARTLDPLETVFICAGTEYLSALPIRERQFIDKPGNNTARGWSNLSLRSFESQQLSSATKETKDLLLKNAFVSIEKKADPEDVVNDEPEEAEEASLSVPLFHWESPEEVFGEIFHCFALNNSMVVVDLTPGSGVSCAAAARSGRRFVGFTHNKLHSDLVKESEL